jgi:hypothetical protein
MMKQLDGPPPPNHIFSKHKVSRLLKRASAFQIGMTSRSRALKKASAEERYSACYTRTGLVPKNKNLLKNWEKDKEFARQYLAGVNPVMINVCKDLSQLSTQIVSHFGNDKLQGLIDEKRLLFVSYDDLVPFAAETLEGKSSNSNPHYGMQVQAPIVLFSWVSNWTAQMMLRSTLMPTVVMMNGLMQRLKLQLQIVTFTNGSHILERRI